MKKTYAIIIMDGFGINPSPVGNAITAAGTPNLDKLIAKYPHTQIGASGLDVGLPNGQMGNSEVGHTNIGAGRVVYQELTRISKMIDDGPFFTNTALVGAMENCRKHDSALHLMGLVSDGGVHSHNEHLYALLDMAKRNGIEKVYIHCFLDGRDVSPTSGAGFVEELEAKCANKGVGVISTVMGRYFAMDREKRWERVEKAYNAIALGNGTAFCGKASDAVKESYKNGTTDEFVEPVVCQKIGVNENDSIIFFNFRPDRARELTRAFVDDAFSDFERSKKNVFFVCMTQYDATMPNVEVAFKPQVINNSFGEVVSKIGLTQLRIAEYTKYAHVTFFFNGGSETVYPGEDRCLIDSPDVATYDLKPEMSAYEVTDKVIESIKNGKHDVIVLNYANCDMVGHTGVFEAAVSAVRTVDECVGRVVEEVLKTGGKAIITADHGNADKMISDDGKEPFTAHTVNKVPFILADDSQIGKHLADNGKLADIAPTMLKLMGIEIPADMDGKSLI